MASTADLMMRLTARDQTGPGMNSAARHAQKLDRALHKMRGTMKVAGAAAAVSAGYFAVDSVKAYAAAETAQNKLQTAYKKFPKLNDTSIASLRAMNAEMQRKTKYDDDDLAVMQSRLAKFDLTGKQVKALTPLIADFATASGKDVVSAGDAFGKALLGNTRSLKSLGISYKSTGNAAKDYRNIVRLLGKKVGGATAAEYDTAAVKLAILKNQFGELKETVGAALMPVLSELATTLASNMPAIQAAIQRNMPTIKQVFGDVATAAKSAGALIGKAYAAFKSLPPGVQDATLKITGLATALGLLAGSPLGKGGKLVVDVIGGAFKALKSMTVAAAVVNVTGKTVTGGGLGGKAGTVGKGVLGSAAASIGLGSGATLIGVAAATVIGTLVAAAVYEGVKNNFGTDKPGGTKNFVDSHRNRNTAKGSDRALGMGQATGNGMTTTTKSKPYSDSGRGRFEAPSVKRPNVEAQARRQEFIQTRALTFARQQYNATLMQGRAAAAVSTAGIRGNTAAAVRNRTALTAQGVQARSLISAYQASGASATQVSAKQQQLGRQFMRTAVSMGVPRAQARAYARQLGLLPSKKSTKVTAPGSKESKNALDRIRNTKLGSKATKVSAPGADKTKAQLDNINRTSLPSKSFTIQSNAGSVLSTVSQLLSKIAELPGKAWQAAFGSAAGGPIYGPGTSTSDSIPVRLSNGEYVIKARSVRRYGVGFLNRVNRGDYEPVGMRFSEGGLADDWRLGKGFGSFRREDRDAVEVKLRDWVWKNKRPGFPSKGKNQKPSQYMTAIIADRRYDPKKDRKWVGDYRAYAKKLAAASKKKRENANNSAVSAFRESAAGNREQFMGFAGLSGFSENLGGLADARAAVVSAGTPAERAAAKANLDRIGKSASPLEWLRGRLATLKTFNEKVKALRGKSGVPASLISEVIAAGPEAGIQLADAIMGPDMKEIFRTWTDVGAEASAAAVATTQVGIRGSNETVLSVGSAMGSSMNSKADNKIEIGLYIDGVDLRAALRRVDRNAGRIK